MKTWSGKDAPILNGKAGEVSVLDLVVQLGRTRRFGGWGDPEWTVAHHTLLVSLLWIRAGYPLDQLHHAMLHDAHEAYLGDTVAPVKQALKARGGGDALRVLESEVDAEIQRALGVGVPGVEACQRIKACDFAALLIEAKAFGPLGCYEAVLELDWPRLPPVMRREVIAVLEAAGFDAPRGLHSAEAANG